MRKLLDKDLVQDVALETGIDPAFVEKDWHATQLLVALAAFQNDMNVQLIFSGGTSLSKGYGLIQRFSEDLDFVLLAPASGTLSAGQRRSFRKDVLGSVIAAGFEIDPDTVQRGDSHRFFKAPITYHKTYENASLRSHLQLEMTFFDLKRPPESRPIQSIIAKVMKAAPETELLCVSPTETAGDKLSALTWRILVRDRKAPNDDPTIIRHLHDLACLSHVIFEDKESFIKSAEKSLEQDRARRGGETIEALPIQDRLAQALNLLQTDVLYRKEYEQFVDNMSYADDEKRISFDVALDGLNKIVALIPQAKG